jgi:acyl-coenzyme A synthetase/AMP-(fatty) acid ligase
VVDPGDLTEHAQVDLTTGRQVLFGEVEDTSRRVASALARLGLRRGDVLYYVTHDTTHLWVVALAAWRLGAAIRGCYQNEQPGTACETYNRDVLCESILLQFTHNFKTKVDVPYRVNL